MVERSPKERNPEDPRGAGLVAGSYNIRTKRKEAKAHYRSPRVQPRGLLSFIKIFSCDLIFSFFLLSYS